VECCEELERGRPLFIAGEGCCGVHGGVHGDGSLGYEGATRGRCGVPSIMAIIECLMVQKKVNGMAREASASATGPAEVVDEGDDDRARERERACLARCWCRGDAMGRGRGQWKD
jgi:hypothetical protein